MALMSRFRSVFNVRGTSDHATGARRHRFPDPFRNEFVVIFGEFCGTFMFLFLAFIGTQTALDTNSSVPGTPLRPFSLMYVAASFGAALAVNVWVFYRVTGGMFNPAVGLLPQLRHSPSLEAHTTLNRSHLASCLLAPSNLSVL
jgi:hypothetical protein